MMMSHLLKEKALQEQQLAARVGQKVVKQQVPVRVGG
jgi:hypothetical protein